MRKIKTNGANKRANGALRRGMATAGDRTSAGSSRRSWPQQLRAREREVDQLSRVVQQQQEELQRAHATLTAVSNSLVWKAAEKVNAARRQLAARNRVVSGVDRLLRKALRAVAGIRPRGAPAAGWALGRRVAGASGWSAIRRALVATVRPDIRLVCETPPFGSAAAVSRQYLVTGWAVAKEGVDRVDVLLDDHVLGVARSGVPRPDVALDYSAYPDAERSGFRFTWDTTRSANGQHALAVRVWSKTGEYAVERGTVEVANLFAGNTNRSRARSR